MQSTTGKTPKEIVVREIARLEKIKVEGLPKCFGGHFDHFFNSFYQEFSTNQTIIKEFDALLKSAPWRKLAREVKKIHGYDFISEIEVGVDVLKQML